MVYILSYLISNLKVEIIAKSALYNISLIMVANIL